MTGRSESRALWERVAQGDLEAEQYDEIDLHAWIRQVARALLAADLTSPAGARPAAIVQAVGLTGQMDGYAELRALVAEARWDFPLIDERGNVGEQRRPDLVREVVAEARRRGLLTGVYADDDKKAGDLVRDILTKRI